MRKIITALCLLTASFSVLAQQKILLYVGPGAGPKSIANTLATLKLVVANKYEIKTVGPEDIIDDTWIKDTALLVIPGGADRPYVAHLSGQGNANIRLYVANGGKFLGICAGAYYSADRIEFAKGDKVLEVTGDRELKFFPGLVIGPTYAGFDYRDVQSVAGMRAAKVYWNEQTPFKNEHEFVIFYNGGGHFVGAENHPNVKVLARYGRELPSQPHQPAAIVECKVGQGKAILSGPHFEWDPASLEENHQDLVQIKSNLAAANQDRLQLVKHLLNRLDIKTKA